MPNGQRLISPEESAKMMPQIPQVDPSTFQPVEGAPLTGAITPEELQRIGPPGSKERVMHRMSAIEKGYTPPILTERTAPTLEGAFPYETSWMEDFGKSVYNEMGPNYLGGLAQLGLGLGKDAFRLFTPSELHDDVNDVVDGWMEGLTRWKDNTRINLSDAANKIGRYQDDYLNANFIASMMGQFLGFTGAIGMDVLLTRGVGILSGATGRAARIISAAERSGKLINTARPVVGGTNVSKLLYSGRYGPSAASLARAQNVLKRAAKRKQTIGQRLTVAELEKLQGALKTGSLIKNIEKSATLTSTLGLIYGGAYDGAVAAGLPPEHRSLFALGAALPMTALMYIPFGMAFGQIMPRGFTISGRNATNKIVKDAAKSFMRGKPTKEAFHNTLYQASTRFGDFYRGHMKRSLDNMAKKIPMHAATTSAVMSSATAVDALAQETYDKYFADTQAVIGEGKFGTEFLSPETLKHSMESAMMGAMGGVLLGALGSISIKKSRNTEYALFHYLRSIKEKSENDPQGAQERLKVLYDDINRMSDSGIIDPQTGRSMRTFIDDIMATGEKSIWGIEEPSAQYQAYNLVKLRRQIEGYVDKLQMEFGSELKDGEGANKLDNYLSPIRNLLAEEGGTNSLLRRIYEEGTIISSDDPAFAILRENVKKLNSLGKNKKDLRIDDEYIDIAEDSGLPKMAFGEYVVEATKEAAEATGKISDFVKQRLGIMKEGLSKDKFWDNLVEKRVLSKDQADKLSSIIKEAPEKFNETKVGELINNVADIGKEATSGVIEAMREEGIISKEQDVTFKSILGKAKEFGTETIGKLTDSLIGITETMREKARGRVREVVKKAPKVVRKAAEEVFEAKMVKEARKTISSTLSKENIQNMSQLIKQRTVPAVENLLSAVKAKTPEAIEEMRRWYDSLINSARQRGEKVTPDYTKKTVEDVMEAFREVKERGKTKAEEIAKEIKEGIKVNRWYDEIGEFAPEEPTKAPRSLYDVFTQNKSNTERISKLKEIGLDIPSEYQNIPLSYVFENARLLTPSAVAKRSLRDAINLSRKKTITSGERAALKENIRDFSKKISTDNIRDLQRRINTVNDAIKQQEGTLRKLWAPSKGKLKGRLPKKFSDLSFERQKRLLDLGPEGIVANNTLMDIVNLFNPLRKIERAEDVTVNDILHSFVMARENAGNFNKLIEGNIATLLDLAEMDLATPGINRGTSYIKESGFTSIQEALDYAKRHIDKNIKKLAEVNIGDLVGKRNKEIAEQNKRAIESSYFYTTLSDKTNYEATAGEFLRGTRTKFDTDKILDNLGLIHPRTGKVLEKGEILKAVNEFIYGTSKDHRFISMKGNRIDFLQERYKSALESANIESRDVTEVEVNMGKGRIITGRELIEILGEEGINISRIEAEFREQRDIFLSYGKEELSKFKPGSKIYNRFDDIPMEAINYFSSALGNKKAREKSLKYIFSSLGMGAIEFTGAKDVTKKSQVYNIVKKFHPDEFIRKNITNANQVTKEIFKRANSERLKHEIVEYENLKDLPDVSVRAFGFRDKADVVQRVMEDPNSRHVVSVEALEFLGRDSIEDITAEDYIDLAKDPVFQERIKRNIIEPLIKKRVPKPTPKAAKEIDPTANIYLENPEVMRVEIGEPKRGESIEEFITRSFGDVKSYARENLGYALAKTKDKIQRLDRNLKVFKEREFNIYNAYKNKVKNIDNSWKEFYQTKPGSEQRRGVIKRINSLKNETTPALIQLKLRELQRVVRKGDESVKRADSDVSKIKTEYDRLQKKVVREKDPKRKSDLINQRKSTMDKLEKARKDRDAIIRNVSGIRSYAEAGKKTVYKLEKRQVYSDAVFESVQLGKVLELSRMDNLRKDHAWTIENIRKSLDKIDNHEYTIDEIKGIKRSIFRQARRIKEQRDIFLNDHGTLEDLKRNPQILQDLGFKSTQHASEMYQHHVLGRGEYNEYFPFFDISFKDLLLASDKMKAAGVESEVFANLGDRIEITESTRIEIENKIRNDLGYNIKIEETRSLPELFKAFTPEQKADIERLLKKDANFKASGKTDVGGNRSPLDHGVTTEQLAAKRAQLQDYFNRYDPKSEISDNARGIAKTYIQQFSNLPKEPKGIKTDAYAKELITKLVEDSRGASVQIPFLRNISSKEVGKYNAVRQAIDRLSGLQEHVDPNYTLIDGLPTREWIKQNGDSPNIKARLGERSTKMLLGELDSVEQGIKSAFESYQKGERKIFNKQYQEINEDGIRSETFQYAKDNPKEMDRIISILKRIYPDVKLKSVKDIVTEKGSKARGVYKEVINSQNDSILRMIEWAENDARLDTVPHEYAHHYIEMFKNDPTILDAVQKLAPERTAEGMRLGREKLARIMGENFIETVTGIKKGEMTYNQASKNPLFKIANDVWTFIKSIFGSSEVFEEMRLIEQGFRRGVEPKRLKDIKKRKSEYYEGYSKNVIKENFPDTKIEDFKERGIKSVIGKIKPEQIDTKINSGLVELKNLGLENKFARETLDNVANTIKNPKMKKSKEKIFQSIMGEKVKLTPEEISIKNNIENILLRVAHHKEIAGKYLLNNDDFGHTGDITGKITQEASKTQAYLDTIPQGATRAFMKYMFSSVNIAQSHLFNVSKLLFGSEDALGHKVVFGQFDKGEARRSDFYGNVKEVLQQDLVGDERSTKSWSNWFNRDIKNISELKGQKISINGGKDKMFISDGEMLQRYMLLRQIKSDIVMKEANGAFDPSTGVELPTKPLEGIGDRKTSISYKLSKPEADAIMKYVEENKGLMKKVAAIDLTLRKIHKLLNPVHKKQTGVDLGKRKDFFPIYRNLKQETKSDVSADISNATFTHQRKIDPKSPIETSDVLDHLDAYINNAANYYSYSIPVRNMKMFLQSPEFGKVKFSENIGDKAKQRIVEFMKEHMAELEDPRMYNELMRDKTVLGKLLNAFPVVALGYNPWVSLKQPISYLLASAEMSKKHSMAGMKIIPNLTVKAYRQWGKEKGVRNLPELDETIRLAAKYSATIKERLQGAIYREMGRTFYQDVNWLTGEDVATGYNILGKRVKAHPFLRKSRVMDWVKLGDTAAVGAIWKASESEVSELFPDLKYGTDAYYKKVAKRVEGIINRTQPTFNATWRTGLRRKKDLFWRGLTMFTAQPTKNYNTMIGSMWDYHVNGKTKTNERFMKKSLASALLFQPLMLGTVGMAQGLTYGFVDLDDSDAIYDHVRNSGGYAVGNFFGARPIYELMTARTPASGIQRMHPMIDIVSGMTDVLSNAGNRTLTENAYKVVYEGAPLVGLPRTPISFVKHTLDIDR